MKDLKPDYINNSMSQWEKIIKPIEKHADHLNKHFTEEI